MVSSPRRAQLSDLREVLTSWQVLEELVKRDLKSRYKRSSLGVLWTMLHPLLMMLVTLIIFSQAFRFAIDNFPVYFLSAYIAWSMFAQGTALASSSIITSAGLAKKIYVPPALFPIAAINASAVNLLLSLPPLLAIMALTGSRFDTPLLFLPLAIAILLFFSYGVALLLATASVFFHDTIHVYSVLTYLWMYLTPLFYPIDIVPADWQPLIQLNPMTALVHLFRAPLYAAQWPEPSVILLAVAWAGLACAAGWWSFERSRDAFISYL